MCLYLCCISMHNFQYLDLTVHTSPQSHKSTYIFRVPTYLQSKKDFEIFSPHIYKIVRRRTSASSLKTIDMIMCCLVGAVTLVKRAIIIVIAYVLTISGVKPKKPWARTELDDPRSKPACKRPSYGAYATKPCIKFA